MASSLYAAVVVPGGGGPMPGRRGTRCPRIAAAGGGRGGGQRGRTPGERRSAAPRAVIPRRAPGFARARRCRRRAGGRSAGLPARSRAGGASAPCGGPSTGGACGPWGTAPRARAGRRGPRSWRVGRQRARGGRRSGGSRGPRALARRGAQSRGGGVWRSSGLARPHGASGRPAVPAALGRHCGRRAAAAGCRAAGGGSAPAAGVGRGVACARMTSGAVRQGQRAAMPRGLDCWYDAWPMPKPFQTVSQLDFCPFTLDTPEGVGKRALFW
jgi:hypothetical protein